MKQHTHKRLYDTHAWVGILSSILLFIVTFSGIPALFEHELGYWQYPAFGEIPEDKSFDLERTIAAANHIGFEYETYFIQLPDEINNHIMLGHFPEEGEFDIRYLKTGSYGEIESSPSALGQILTHLHTDLYLPRPYGRYLVGLAGMAMLLAIIAGILIHVKWRKEFVMLRPKRSWRLLLTDQHKLLGLWSLPFTFILAFTGTILGLLGIITPILALAAFDGDVQKATDTVLGPRAEIIGEPAPTYPLNELWNKAQLDLTDKEIKSIEIEGVGDKGGIIKFSAHHKVHLSNIETVTYSTASGEMIHEGTFIGKGPFHRIFAAVTPLHYVLFGSIWLKICYALAALGACGLIITGNMLWLERRGHSMEHWLSKLTLGACGGLVVATCAAFPVSQLLYVFNLGAEHHHVEELVLWITWGLALFTPLFWKNGFQLSHWMLRISAALLLSTLVVDGLVHGRWLWLTTGWDFYIQAGLIFSALLFMYLDIKMPNEKKEKLKTKDVKIQVKKAA
ncbi:MAG: PepSY domain-containing protein [Bermanella sp.]